MKKRFLSMAMLGVIAASLYAAPGASAATVIGDECSGNDLEAPVSFFEFSAPANALQTAAPANGVITKWGVNVIPFPGTLPLTLQAIRIVSANQVQVLSENSVNVVGGGNSFATRIPIQAGDRIALHGSTSEMGTLVCESGTEEAHIGGFAPVGPGSTTLFEQADDNFRVPLTASIEPDADNDGFGDETQDLCPQNAAIQTACPLPVTLSTFKQVKKGSVTVVVTPSAASTVSVKGVANLGKGKKATLRGGTQILAPALQGKFKLFFTKPLKTKLKELSPKKKLTLKVTVAGTNVVGPETLKTLKVKLKGQAKP